MKAQMVSFIPLMLVFCPSLSRSQTPAAKDPRAVSLLSAAVSALANGINITDVTLSGTVTRTAGSDVENGAVTLRALGGGDGRIDMTLTTGPRSEVISQSGAEAAGQWSGPDGTAHAVAQHNSLTPAAWFFPELALAQALNGPSVQIAYVGQEMKDDVATQHIRFWRVFPAGSGSAATVALLGRLSTADVYLDATNSLPVALDFNIHPDNNAVLDIPVEIQFGDYEKSSGTLVPKRIRKLINGSLFLNLSITGVALNTNLSPTDFATMTAGQ